MEKQVILQPADAEFIFSLLPQWAKYKAPKGLDATFYGTLTEDGDNKVQERVNR